MNFMHIQIVCYLLGTSRLFLFSEGLDSVAWGSRHVAWLQLVPTLFENH